MKKYSGCSHKTAAASAAAVFCFRTIPSEMKRVKSPQYLHAPLIKTAGEAKISGSFLQSKATQTPPRILAGDSPEFSLYAPMRKAPAAEKFTAFIHRLCLSVSARRAGKRHRDFSPREESGSAGIFLRGDSADLSFSGTAGTRSAETFPCLPRDGGKSQKTWQKQGKMLARKAFF